MLWPTSRSPTFVVRVRVFEVLATQRHQGQQTQAHALHCVNATCATHVLSYWAYQAHMQSWCLLIRWRQCCGRRLPNRFIDVPHCLSASAPKPVSRLAKTLPHHDAQPSYCQKLKISFESWVENQFSDPKRAVIVRCCQLSQLRTIRHAALPAWMLWTSQQITNVCCACAFG